MTKILLARMSAIHGHRVRLKTQLKRASCFDRFNVIQEDDEVISSSRRVEPAQTWTANLRAFGQFEQSLPAVEKQKPDPTFGSGEC